MATIEDGVYKRKDREGYWIQWIGKDGRRRVRKAKSTYLQGARREREDLMRTGTNKTAPFAELADQFLAYQRPRLTPAAYERERGIVEELLKPFFPGVIASVAKADISRYVSERLAKVKSATVRKELNVLKHLFRLSVEEWAQILVSPAHGVKPPKKPADRVRFVQPGELRTIINSCPNWLQPIASLAAFTGMRRSEILNLRWLDVSLERGIILLPQTKNGDGRVVYLNQTAIESLCLLPLSIGTKPTDKLFGDVTPAQVSQCFLRVCRKVNIQDFHFHDLRHTHASWLRQQGTQLDVIAKQLGHRDLRMTARYAHLADSQVQDAVGALDAVFDATRYPSATDGIGEPEKKAVND
jgi:integrase